MRREAIDCDVCGERIAEAPTRSAQKLLDMCVQIEVTAASNHVELKSDAPIDTGSGVVSDVLHVCFKCADERLAGWGPFKGFIAEEPPPEAPVAEGSARHLPKLSNVSRYLDVVVKDGDEEIVVHHNTNARHGSAHAPILEWEAGSHVSARLHRGWTDVVVVGYAVKEKLAWDTATPDCEDCQRETLRGERVTLRDAGPNSYVAICLKCAAKKDDASAPLLLPAS